MGSTSNDAAPMHVGMNVASFSADKSLVSLDRAGQHLVERSVMQREANAVHHVPCGLLRDSEIAGHFLAADTVLARDEQPHGREPLFKRDGAFFNDGPSLQSEGGAFMLAVAFPHARLG